MAPVKKPATYADIEALPEHLVGELIDGELFVSPRPASLHAFAESAITTEIGGRFGSGRSPGGWWVIAEPELHLGRNVLVPDLAAWRIARMPEFPDAPFFTMVPDWVCEIVSPSTGRLDRVRKLPLYANEGVDFAWLVDPPSRTFEARRRDGTQWVVVGSYSDESATRVPPFDDAEIDVTRFWPPTLERRSV